MASIPTLRCSPKKQLPLSHSITIAAALTIVMSSSDLITQTLAQGIGKAPKPYVGSAMAVLATLEQAKILPPENTPEANHIIKAVIQFQSAFAHSDDLALQDFAHQAVATRYGGRSPELITEFRVAGWTAPVLEALSDAELHLPAEQLQGLAGGFHQFNLSIQDFHRFMVLVREARQAFAQQGLRFEEVYAAHRRTMPGGKGVR